MSVLSRCQHCDKLTHSEHLYVEYDAADQDKIFELTCLKDWAPAYMYFKGTDDKPFEYGKLKCGDIYIHFVAKRKIE